MNITISYIDRVVRTYFGVEDLRTPSRARRVARPRQIAMYLCREYTHASLPELGRYFFRDHSTILHGDRRVRELVSQNHFTKRHIDALRSKIDEVAA